MRIYCHQKTISYAENFTRSYFKEKDNESDANNFYWMGRYLFEAVQFFGKRFDEVNKSLYQGIVGRFQYDFFAPTINFPVLCNQAQNIALRFAQQKNGCTLKLIPKYLGEIDDTKCFPLHQWNDTTPGGWYVYL